MMIKTLRPFGDLLQIGFGKKTILEEIQSYFPKTHTLIEGDPLVLEKAKKTLEKHPQIKLIADIWPKALPTLGVFDTIYCEIREIGEDLFTELTRIRYSDRDLDLFCESTAKNSPAELFRFLHELAHFGQITHEQLDRMIQKYQLKGPPFTMKRSCREMVACLNVCLASHMREGSRFAARLEDVSLIYDEPLFFPISVDPFVEVSECEGGILIEKLGQKT